jgi:hypothetical protein
MGSPQLFGEAQMARRSSVASHLSQDEVLGRIKKTAGFDYNGLELGAKVRRREYWLIFPGRGHR